MKKIFLRSYFNINLGDDLFIDLICKRYKDYAKIYIDNKNYKFMIKRNENAMLISNIIYSLYNKLIIKLKKIDLITSKKYLKKSDALLVLGGSMFIEHFPNNIYDEIYESYYKCGKDYYIVGANFGPYSNQEYLNKYELFFDKAKDVCLRDKKSYNLFNHLKSVRYAPDIIFGYKKYLPKDIAEKKQVFISVINMENRDKLKQCQEEYIKSIVNICQYYQEKDYKIIISSFCKSEGDEKMVNYIYEMLESKHNIRKLCYNKNIEEIMIEMQASKVIFGTRFHAVVLGMLMEKYVVPIIYSNKTLELLKDLKFEGEYARVENVSELQFSEENIISDKQKIKNMDHIIKESDYNFIELDKYIMEG